MSQIKISGSRRSLRNATNDDIEGKEFTPRTSLGATCLAFAPLDEGAGTSINIYGELCAFPSDVSTDALTSWTDNYATLNHNTKALTGFAPALGHEDNQASNHVLYVVVQKNALPANYAAVFSDANGEQYLGLKNNGTDSQLLVVDGLLPQGAAQSLIVPNTENSVFALLIDADANRIYYYVDGVVTFTTPEDQFLLTGINSLTLNDGEAGTAVADLYGVALFHFNDFPHDWHSAVSWMGAEWKAGRKSVWPYWSRIVIGPPPVRGVVAGVPVNQAPITVDSSMLATVSATTPGRFRASDPENAPLTYTIVSNGTLGTATITNASTGAFDYVAGAVEGEDTLTFTASDGLLTSNTGTVTVTVVPDVIIPEPNTAPVANNLTATVEVNLTITGFLSGSDADNNPLTYTIITNGRHGTATITNAATGAFSYRAGANAGSDNITYKVNDGIEDSNIATLVVTVTPKETPPVGTVSWNLDFTSNASFGTFTRTGTASTTSATLNTTSAASGAARYPYPLADGINRGLWIQPAYVDVTQQFGAALTNGDYWVSTRTGPTGTATATVVGGIADINGGTSAFRVTGTDQGNSSQRMGLAHLFDANELGELETSEQTVAYGTGITQPSPGAILRGATNGGIFEVRSVTLTSGSWDTDNAAGTMSIKLHTGSLATGEAVHALGDPTTMFTTTGAAAAVANSATLPVTSYALVKRTSSTSWPWLSMRVVSELNTSHEVLFDFIRGTATKQKPASPIGEVHGYGMKYRKNGWYLIWITYNVRASASTVQAKVQVGFGKPISYHLSTAATAGNRPVIEDYVYFCDVTTPTGAWGRVAREVNQGDTIIYFTETSGTINNGDKAVLSATAPGSPFATVVVESSPTITPSYSLMFKATAAGGVGESFNMTAQTFDIQYIGTVRNHMPPMVPITNAVTDTTPNHVWVRYDGGTNAVQTPATGDAITTAGAGGVLLNAPYDETNATDRFYGAWTGTASGMLHLNKTSGTFIDNAAVQKAGGTFATVNGAEAASSYRVQYPEKLQFNSTTGSYLLPTANFAQVIKFFNPCRNYEGHWKKLHAYTSAGAEITPSHGDFEFRRNASGTTNTTGSTEPDWLTKDGGGAMAAGDTKTDGTVTWTAYNPPQFYLWSSGTVSLRKLRQSIRFYVDASNYIDWRINDGMLYYHKGTASAAVAATLIHGATVTGAFSGATATLLANPAITSTGAWTGAATGLLALRPLSGIFIPREPLQVSSVTFATCLGVVQKSNGTFDEGDYKVAMKRTAANGTELWVNGFLRAQKATSGAFSTTPLPIGATWFLGSDTNGVNQAGMQFYGIELQTET